MTRRDDFDYERFDNRDGQIALVATGVVVGAVVVVAVLLVMWMFNGPGPIPKHVQQRVVANRRALKRRHYSIPNATFRLGRVEAHSVEPM